MRPNFIFFLIVAALFAVTVPSSDAQTKNRLDEMVEALQTPQGPFIKSYKIEGGSAYLVINSRLWDMLTKDQQLRLCNQIADTDFLHKMKLLNAWLLVDGTTIGRVGPRITGGWEFKPEDKYWKYR